MQLHEPHEHLELSFPLFWVFAYHNLVWGKPIGIILILIEDVIKDVIHLRLITYHSNQSRRKLGFSWPNSKPRLCEWILTSSSHAVATAETLNKNKTRKTRKAPHPPDLVSKNVIKSQKAIPCSFFAWQVLAFVLKIIDCLNRSKSIYLCSLVKSATPLLFQNLSSGRKPVVPDGELAKPGCMILICYSVLFKCLWQDTLTEVGKWLLVLSKSAFGGPNWLQLKWVRPEIRLRSSVGPALLSWQKASPNNEASLSTLPGPS